MSKMWLKRGLFIDAYRGSGCFVSVNSNSRSVLLALRWRWLFSFVRMPFHHKVRVYFGPIELEIANFSTHPSGGDRHGE